MIFISFTGLVFVTFLIIAEITLRCLESDRGPFAAQEKDGKGMAPQLHEQAVQEGKDKDQAEGSFEAGGDPFRLPSRRWI